MTPSGVAGPRAYGVYGLAVTGLGLEARGRPSPPGDWHAWTITQELVDADDSEGMTVTRDHARIGMPGAGEIRVDRLARAVVFAVRRPLAPEAVLHPGMVPAAAIIAWWMDRVPVHASAVVVGGRAWGLLADREGGKSTTAALLSAGSEELLTDDMLIVEGDRCFAGPGSVDLREESAQALGGTPLGIIGSRERFRKGFDTSRLEAPLAGWVELAWAPDDEVSVTELAVGDRIGALGHHASLPVTGDQLLDLAMAPMLRFSRPRVMGRLAEGIEVLRSAMAHR